MDQTTAQKVSDFWGAEIDAQQVTLEKNEKSIVVCISSELAEKACQFESIFLQKGYDINVITRPCMAIEITIQ